MALSWNITDVKDWKKIDEEGIRGVLDTLLYMTMIVGMGEITEKNYKQFFARLDFAQKVSGPFMWAVNQKSKKPKNVLFTEEHIKRFIGLSTNVTYETPSAWVKRFLRQESAHF